MLRYKRLDERVNLDEWPLRLLTVALQTIANMEVESYDGIMGTHTPISFVTAASKNSGHLRAAKEMAEEALEGYVKAVEASEDFKKRGWDVYKR